MITRRDIKDFSIFSLLTAFVTIAMYYENILYVLTRPSSPVGTDASFYLGLEGYVSRAVFGHFLSLRTSDFIRAVVPKSFVGATLALFFTGFFCVAAYLFSTEYLKRPYLIGALLPLSLFVKRIAFSGTYAQLFSISFFLISAWLWLKNHYLLAIGVLVPCFLAHFWAGAFLVVVGAVYVFVFDREVLVSYWRELLLIGGVLGLGVVLLVGIDYLIYLKAPIMLLNSQDLSLFDTLIRNSANIPGPIILWFFLFGVVFFDLGESGLCLVLVWFLVGLVGIVGLGFGNVSHRVWVMFPFVFVSGWGLDLVVGFLIGVVPKSWGGFG